MVHNWDNIDFEIILHLLKESVHVRGLSNALNIPRATLARKLLNLRASNMIDYVQEGKNKKYFLKKNLFAKKAVVLSEHYKLLKLLSTEPKLFPLISDILRTNKSKLIILFGSYAKGTQSSTSDIDIYVEAQNVREKKELENLNTKISVKYSVFNSENLLIREIIKNHVILRGVEDFYDKKGVFD